MAFRQITSHPGGWHRFWPGGNGPAGAQQLPPGTFHHQNQHQPVGPVRRVLCPPLSTAKPAPFLLQIHSQLATSPAKMVEKQEEQQAIEDGEIVGPLPQQNGLDFRGRPSVAYGLLLYHRARSHSPNWPGPRKKRCGPKVDTQERLFGGVSKMPETPKKKVTDTFRSSIFDTSAPNSPAKTPKKSVPILERNPITGEVKIPKKITM